MKQNELAKILGFGPGVNTDGARFQKDWHSAWRIYREAQMILHHIEIENISEDHIKATEYNLKAAVEDLKNVMRALKSSGAVLLPESRANNFLWSVENGTHHIGLGYQVAPEGIEGIEENLLRMCRLAEHFRIRINKKLNINQSHEKNSIPLPEPLCALCHRAVDDRPEPCILPE